MCFLLLCPAACFSVVSFESPPADGGVRADGDCSWPGAGGQCQAPIGVTAGGNHTCIVRKNGKIWCWGENTVGQLVINDLTPLVSLPVRAATFEEMKEVRAGLAHTCARGADDERVWCWGDNSKQQTGILKSSTTSVSLPQVVPDLKGVTQLTAGAEHNCGIVMGDVYCWGSNESGQLGRDTSGLPSAPEKVLYLNSVTQVSAGKGHTCAISAGTVACWGGNDSYQVGSSESSRLAWGTNIISSLKDITKVSAGATHTCALSSDGRLTCWGSNQNGQLGLSNVQTSSTPLEVPGITDVIDVSAGEFHTCAATEAGDVYCWGGNAEGQLGDGMEASRSKPEPVVQMSNARQVAAGRFHGCALTSGGHVACWGLNVSGQLGIGNEESDGPIRVPTRVGLPPPDGNSGMLYPDAATSLDAGVMRPDATSSMDSGTRPDGGCDDPQDGVRL